MIVKPPVMRIRELKTDAAPDPRGEQAETIDLLKRCTRFDVDVWLPRDWQRIVEELTHG